MATTGDFKVTNPEGTAIVAPPTGYVASDVMITKVVGGTRIDDTDVVVSFQLQPPSAPQAKHTLDFADSEKIPAGTGKAETGVPQDSEQRPSIEIPSKEVAPSIAGATAGTLAETDDISDGSNDFDSDEFAPTGTLGPTSAFPASRTIKGTVREGVTSGGGDTEIFLPESEEVPVTGVDVTAGAIGTEGVESEQMRTIAAAGTKVDASLEVVDSLVVPAGTQEPNATSDGPADSEVRQPSGLMATGVEPTDEAPVSDAELTKDPTGTGVFGDASGAVDKTAEVQPSEIGATLVVVSEDPVASDAGVTGVFDKSKADVDSESPQASAKPVGSGTGVSLVFETEPPAGSADAEIGSGALDSQQIEITFDPRASARPRVTDAKQSSEVGQTGSVAATGDEPPSVNEVTDGLKDSRTTRGTRLSRSATFDVSENVATESTDGTGGIATTTGVRTFAMMVSSLFRTSWAQATQKPSLSEILGETGIPATGDATGSRTPGDETKVIISETPEPSDVRMRTRELPLTDKVATAVHIVTDTKVQTALRATIADVTRWVIVSEMAPATDLVGSAVVGPTFGDDRATEIVASLSRRATSGFTASMALQEATRMNLKNTWWFWLLIVLGIVVIACAVFFVIWRGRRSSESFANKKMETNVSFPDPAAAPITCSEDSEMAFISQDNPIFLTDASEGDLSQIYCSSSEGIDFATALPPDEVPAAPELRPRFVLPPPSDSGDDDDGGVWGALTEEPLDYVEDDGHEDDGGVWGAPTYEEPDYVEDDGHEDDPAAGYNALYGTALEDYAEYDGTVVF